MIREYRRSLVLCQALLGCRNIRCRRQTCQQESNDQARMRSMLSAANKSEDHKEIHQDGYRSWRVWSRTAKIRANVRSSYRRFSRVLIRTPFLKSIYEVKVALTSVCGMWDIIFSSYRGYMFLSTRYKLHSRTSFAY
jgi:hypothetical protein